MIETQQEINIIEQLASCASRADACRKCEISEKRDKNVFADGNPFARVMIVGEGPGETEDRTGVPYVGPAGDLLNKMLLSINIKRDEVYIANVLKCRASEVVNNRVKNRQPTRQEAENCSEYLQEQIRLVRPEVIIATGAPAAKALVGDPNFSITRGRGQWYQGPYGIPLMVTFHPAYILRLQGEDLNEKKRLVWGDLKLVRAMLDGQEVTLQGLYKEEISAGQVVKPRKETKKTETALLSLFG